MWRSRKMAALVVAALVVASLLVPFVGYADGSLTAAKTTTAPKIDGQVDAAWGSATALSIKTSGGVNFGGSGSTDVVLKALYDSSNVYFLAQWKDPTESNRRAPFQKKADGTWVKLVDPNDKGSDNNVYYEDKLAFIWNVNDSIKGFNQAGCFVTCHAGETGKPYGNKYTTSAGEIGDIWHWKGVRTGPVGQIDDQYLDDTRYDKDKSPEAGRKSDAKVSGGYADNVLENGKPKFALKDNKPTPPYWIVDSEKVAFDDTKYKANDEVPGIIISAMTGDRADLSSGQVYKDGMWTLEWSRKLTTGSKTDVQFTDLSKSYYFGVAAFDNAQVRHAYQTGASEFKFAAATASATALPKAGEPYLQVLGLVVAGLVLVALGGALVAAKSRL